MSLEKIGALPKVELHVHLEGAMSAERIAHLAAEAGEPLPRPQELLFEFQDFADFIGSLSLWCGLVRNAEHAAQVAYDLADQLARNGVAYAEALVTPVYWPGLDRESLVEGICAGFQRAHEDGLSDCRLVVSLDRGQAVDDAMTLVEWLGGKRLERVVGLGIDGDEVAAGRTGERFAPAFARARELGLGLTAHAGESSGPEGVEDALDLLRVARIDHGVRAAEDGELLARLARERVPCNVCPTSNLLLMYPDMDAHPLRAMIEAGVRVTISTDDPEPFRVSINDELALVADHLNWGIDDLIRATGHAIDAAFCDDGRKAALRSDLAGFAESVASPARRQPSHG